jgi:hypothetical protein
MNQELAEKLQTSKQVTLLGLIQEGLEQARIKLDRPVEEPAPIEKAGKFYLLNTNRAHGNRDHDWMLAGGRAAAFHKPWTENIDRIRKGYVVFLYSNRVGIVGYGYGTGKVETSDHGGQRDACHYQVLDKFKRLEKPISAAELKKIIEADLVFFQTMAPLPRSEKLIEAADKRSGPSTR